MDMAVNTLAAVLVPDGRLLDRWLGAKPLLRWSLDKVAEIRGIDFTCVVVPPPADRKALPHYPACVLGGAALFFAPREINVADDYAVARWLLWQSNIPQALKAEHLLVLKPERPLLLLANVQQIFHTALARGSDFVALTGRQVDVLDVHYGVAPKTELVRGAWACHRKFLKDERPHWCRNSEAIPVSSVESLNILDPHEALAVQALANQGGI